VVLGDLQTQQFEIRLPGTAFQGPTLVTVQNTTSAPAVPAGEFTPLGAPIEITIGKQPTRLSDLATVTFKLDRAVIEKNPDPGAYWVAHYTGGEWEYLKPDEVNLDEGTISVWMDNFSPVAWGKIEVEEAIQQYTENKAVAEWGQAQVDEQVNGAITALLNPILDKFGFTEEGNKELVTKIFTDPEYGKLKEAIEKGNTGDISEKLGTLVGSNLQIILENKQLDQIWVNKTQIVGPVTAVTENLATVAALAQALGNASGGNYEEAASILVKDVATNFIKGSATPVQVILALKGAGEDAAKFLNDRMFEQAYQVWATGSTAGMGMTQKHAYQDVGKGEFKNVWDQSDYVRRQLTDSYMNKGFTDRGKAAEQAKEDLRKQFEARQEKESEIAQKEKEIKDLLGVFERGLNDYPTLEKFLFPLEKGFLGITAPVEIPPKEKLDELLKIVETIKKDTGTTTVGGKLKPGVLQEQDLLLLASALIDSRPTLYDPDYRSLEYLKILKRYTFSISAPPNISAGKGMTGLSYSFTAKGNNIGEYPTYKWFVNGINETLNPNSDSFSHDFISPGEYTVKCRASWTSDMSGHYSIPTEAVATLTFNISGPSELKINVSPTMPSGKGAADTSYVFTATGTAIPVGAEYTWTLKYAADEKVQSSKTNTLTGALRSPGEYTLSCLAKWKEKTSGGQVDREAVAAPLAFAIPLTISPILLDGEAGNSYTFTIENGDSPPGGTYYKWLKDGTAQTGKAATIAIAFPDKGTYTIEAQLVATASGNVIARDQVEANIAAATPTPAPAPEVRVPVNGSLNIGSVPAGADIYVDGQKLSYQTPHKFVDNIEAGIYHLVLKKAGYLDHPAKVTIGAGQLTDMNPTLVKIESKQESPTQPTQPTQPTPPAKDPQTSCNCIQPYQQKFYLGDAIASCKSQGKKDCNFRLDIIKPWTYDPAFKGCVGTWKLMQQIYDPVTKQYNWYSVASANPGVVDLGTAQDRCNAMQK
jgi:hypothetical protein